MQPEAGTASGEGLSATAEVVVGIAQGLHLRPSTEFARIAQDSGCSVTVDAGHGPADGSSVLELAMMAAGAGTSLTITVHGRGAAAVLDRLRDVLLHAD